jgi:hypothetical protein
VLGMHNATIVQMLCETDCNAIAGPIYRPEGVAIWSVLTFCNGLMSCLPTWWRGVPNSDSWVFADTCASQATRWASTCCICGDHCRGIALIISLPGQWVYIIFLWRVPAKEPLVACNLSFWSLSACPCQLCICIHCTDTDCWIARWYMLWVCQCTCSRKTGGHPFISSYVVIQGLVFLGRFANSASLPMAQWMWLQRADSGFRSAMHGHRLMEWYSLLCKSRLPVGQHA